MEISGYGANPNTPASAGVDTDNRTAEQKTRDESIETRGKEYSAYEKSITKIAEDIKAIPEKGYVSRLKTFLGIQEGKQYDETQEKLGQAQDQNLEQQEKSNKQRIWKAFVSGAAGGLGAFGVNGLVVGGFTGPFSPAWAAIIGITTVGFGAAAAYREAQKIKQQEIEYQKLERAKEKNIQAREDNEKKIQERLKESNNKEINLLNNRITKSTENITKNHTEILKSLNTELSKPKKNSYNIEIKERNVIRLFSTLKDSLNFNNRQYIESYNKRELFSIPGLSETTIINDFRKELFGKQWRTNGEDMKFVLTMLQDYIVPVKMGTEESAATEQLSLKKILSMENQDDKKAALFYYQRSLKDALDKISMNDLLSNLVKIDSRNLVLPITGEPKSVDSSSSDIDVLARYRYLLRDTSPYTTQESTQQSPDVQPVETDPKKNKLSKALQDIDTIANSSKDRIAKYMRAGSENKE